MSVLTAEQQEVKALLESVQFVRLAVNDHLHEDIIRLVTLRTASLTERLAASELRADVNEACAKDFAKMSDLLEQSKRELTELRQPGPCGLRAALVRAAVDEIVVATGPTGGWLVSPKQLKEAIEAALNQPSGGGA